MSSAFLVLGEVSLDAAQGRPGKGAPAAAVVGRLVVAYQYTFACAVGRLYALLALDALTVRLLTFVQQERFASWAWACSRCGGPDGSETGWGLMREDRREFLQTPSQAGHERPAAALVQRAGRAYQHELYYGSG